MIKEYSNEHHHKNSDVLTEGSAPSLQCNDPIRVRPFLGRNSLPVRCLLPQSHKGKHMWGLMGDDETVPLVFGADYITWG